MSVELEYRRQYRCLWRLAEDSLSAVYVIALNAIMAFVITIVALFATCYEGRVLRCVNMATSMFGHKQSGLRPYGRDLRDGTTRDEN